MKTLALILSCLWGFGASSSANDRIAFEPPEKAEQILTRMRAEKCPRVDYEDTTLEEGIDFWRMKDAGRCYIEGKRPKRFGISMSPELRGRKIARLQMRNLNLETFLTTVCEMTGCWVLATEDMIEFHPGDRVSPAVLAAYRAPALKAARDIIIPELLLDDMNLVEAAEAVYEALPESVKQEGKVKIFLDASVDQQVKVRDFRWRNVRLSDLVRYHLAAGTGHRLRADRTTLRILK